LKRQRIISLMMMVMMTVMTMTTMLRVVRMAVLHLEEKVTVRALRRQ